MNFLDPRELVFFAKANSPFYGDLYSSIKEEFRWEDLPVINQSQFWEANSWKDNQLLTCKHHKGLLFKSGGTTGKPKFSYFSDQEWAVFCELFGRGMGEANLREGDHVGNLFYAGELYASFLFIHKSLEMCKKRIIQFPLAGKMALEDLVSNILEFQINVLCGVPTSFIQLASYCLEKKHCLPIERLLYGGEALYPDQEDLLLQAFPNIEIHSVGYASVDGGLLGKRAVDCRGSEHRVFQDSTLMEIIDDDGSVITEPLVEGRLLLTNLTRKLMPIIRYPVGDQAQWIEVDKKFKICGRSEEGARIGPITLNRDDLVSIFDVAGELKAIAHFQMEITHFKGLDCLTIKLVLKPRESMNVNQLEEAFYGERKMFQKAVKEKIVHPVVFILGDEDDLFKNPRTGKCPVIVDRRLI
jgi:phenylacetate-CoA ligase